MLRPIDIDVAFNVLMPVADRAGQSLQRNHSPATRHSSAGGRQRCQIDGDMIRLVRATRSTATFICRPGRSASGLIEFGYMVATWKPESKKATVESGLSD